MTDKLTDFTDTSDVSDAAIEWVSRVLGYGNGWTAPAIRNDAAGGDRRDRAIIIAARLIQAHRPELLVDPVDAIVREIVAKEHEQAGDFATAARVRMGHCRRAEAAAKSAYLLGLEAGKAEG